MVPQYRWDKYKRLILEVVEMESMEDERLDWAKMKYVRVFIVYVARTYQDMNPYLKGLHFNLDSKSPFRDKEGW